MRTIWTTQITKDLRQIQPEAKGNGERGPVKRCSLLFSLILRPKRYFSCEFSPMHSDVCLE